MKDEMKEEKEQQSSGVSRRSFLRNSLVSMAAVPAMAIAAEAAPAPKTPPAAPKTPPAAPAAKPAKSLMVFRKNCTGCHSCEYACSLYHEGVVYPAAARIHVRRIKGIVDVVSICWHCPDAPCVEACPVTPKKAIYKDKETNVVKYLDEKLCLGSKCNKCVEACPPQYLRVHPVTSKPLFCDLCGGDPKCVKACNRQSRETGEVLRCDAVIGGVHRSFRDVTPDDAVEGMLKNLYYPNTDGGRR
ncbi:MAG: 4Fe-4S dicluster domain-containing protein [Desulfovibrio sp.]|nr:4Fe-4S dicluster domain-containing protein [Desulfovibrio sp.]